MKSTEFLLDWKQKTGIEIKFLDRLIDENKDGDSFIDKLSLIQRMKVIEYSNIEEMLHQIHIEGVEQLRKEE